MAHVRFATRKEAAGVSRTLGRGENREKVPKGWFLAADAAEALFTLAACGEDRRFVLFLDPCHSKRLWVREEGGKDEALQEWDNSLHHRLSTEALLRK